MIAMMTTMLVITRTCNVIMIMWMKEMMKTMITQMVTIWGNAVYDTAL